MAAVASSLDEKYSKSKEGHFHAAKVLPDPCAVTSKRVWETRMFEARQQLAEASKVRSKLLAQVAQVLEEFLE